MCWSKLLRLSAIGGSLLPPHVAMHGKQLRKFGENLHLGQPAQKAALSLIETRFIFEAGTFHGFLLFFYP